MKKTLYIFSAGEFQRKDNTLYFVTREGEKKFIPVEDTAELMIFGEVDVNKRFLEFISQKEIIIHYFNHYGYYMGCFYPREHLNSGYMILKQTEHYLDENKKMMLARRFVEGASLNILRVLKYYQKRGKDLAPIIANIERLMSDINCCHSTSALMALEGNIREEYYKAFDNIINNPLFLFKTRTRRPPKNYLNTLISFGNSLLYSICLSEIYKTHLDPRIGFLHSTNFRRFTLNLDVAEIFKPIVVDRVIFTLIGRNMISTGDFAAETEGIYLNEKGRKCFIEQMEEKLKSTIVHREIGRAVSYRRLIRLELYKLEKHLMGEQEYKPFVALW